MRDLAYKTIQVRERLTKETGKEPGIEEIAKELETTPEDIAFSLDAIQDPVSLQEPVYNDGADSIYIMDQVKDVKNTDELWAENITILEAMKKLSDKEKLILYILFEINHLRSHFFLKIFELHSKLILNYLV